MNGNDKQVQPATTTVAAQEAVAYLDIGAGGYLDLYSNLPEVQLSALPKGRHALGIIGTYGIDGYVAAPIAAAPVVDVAILRALADRWATDRSYTGSPVDDIRALIEQPTISTPASSADSAVLTNPYTGQPRDYRDVESDPAGTLIVEPGKPLEAASTPAAPGIDLAGLREMLDGWKNSDYPLSYEGQCAQKALNACIADVEGLLTDASPKGGSGSTSLDSAIAFLAELASVGNQRAGSLASELRGILHSDHCGPKGGSDAISVEGTVVFERSEGAGKHCVCCPDSPAHIYGRHIEWEGKSRPDQNALDIAILEQVLYVSGNEGKRVRVTIDVLQATSAEVGS